MSSATYYARKAKFGGLDVSDAKREAVAHLQTALGMSERRACAVVGAERKSMRYRSCRPDDGDLRSRLLELAQQRGRFGYRRLHILLRRDGITIKRHSSGQEQSLGHRFSAIPIRLWQSGHFSERFPELPRKLPRRCNLPVTRVAANFKLLIYKRNMVDALGLEPRTR
jgi:hypothetical protein